MRRRARFLRKARELAYRDLGGLVFDLHRFGARNDEVVSAKLATLAQMDAELRALERVLGDSDTVTVLREVGIAACPRCAAIHGRDDRFCPGCGLAFDANAERPLSTSPVNAPTSAPAPSEIKPVAPSASTAPPVIPTAPPVAAPPAAPPVAAPPAAPPVAAPPTAPPAAAPPTTPPVAAPPTTPPVAAPSSGGTPSTNKDADVDRSGSQADSDKPAVEEQPTQILHPPVRGA